MRSARAVSLCLALALLCLAVRPAQAQRREYLNEEEIDKIRDAQEPNQRAKLFLKFASERLQRFQQALASPAEAQQTTASRREFLNELLAGFTSCVDDAADALQLGQKRGEMVMKGALEMSKLAPGYLKTLEEFEKNPAPEFSAYQDTLDDAIEATRDALNDAKKLVAEEASRSSRKEKQ